MITTDAIRVLPVNKYKGSPVVRLTLKELIAGDHIYVKRKGYFYSHHGIYAGNGRVLHFRGAVQEKKDPTVILSDVDTFLKNGRLQRRTYKQRLPHAQSVKIARAHLAQKGYSLVFNNCEHFATYCATGKKKSPQVSKIIGGMATLALAVTGMFIRKKTRFKKGNPSVS
ncbi:MAG: lecithin retinol acyltransferase family protein [Desulfobacterales bacterium]|nr:lecithin retinol acyltransferase family protein [Desulfobacterales bacterium]